MDGFWGKALLEHFEESEPQPILAFALDRHVSEDEEAAIYTNASQPDYFLKPLSREYIPALSESFNRCKDETTVPESAHSSFSALAGLSSVACQRLHATK